MSEATHGQRPVTQEFESALAGASTAHASFEEESPSLLKRVQRFLHVYPTTVPFVVLLLGEDGSEALRSTRTIESTQLN